MKKSVLILLFLMITFAYAEEIKVTNNHPFLVNDSWIEASELNVGDYLTSTDGKIIKITNIQDIQETNEVFNFETLFHNYVVFPDIIVHNSNSFPFAKLKPLKSVDGGTPVLTELEIAAFYSYGENFATLNEEERVLFEQLLQRYMIIRVRSFMRGTSASINVVHFEKLYNKDYEVVSGKTNEIIFAYDVATDIYVFDHKRLVEDYDKSKGKFSSWIYSMSKNAYIDYLRDNFGGTTSKKTITPEKIQGDRNEEVEEFKERSYKSQTISKKCLREKDTSVLNDESLQKLMDEAFEIWLASTKRNVFTSRTIYYHYIRGDKTGPQIIQMLKKVTGKEVGDSYISLASTEIINALKDAAFNPNHPAYAKMQELKDMRTILETRQKLGCCTSY